MKIYHILFVFIFLVVGRSISLAATKDTYKAGVVEYHPSSGSLLEVVENNLARYIELISLAASENVDILVFPEATLNRDWQKGEWSTFAAIQVPSKEDNVIPCNENKNYSAVLVQISCAAAVEKMYVVINVGEKAICPKDSNGKCKEGEDVFFNTNVVFDRNGAIISKYRKANLFGENGFTESLDGAYETFKTDFDVTFGHFICFDLIFQVPAVQIVDMGVTNVIFPTMWFSEMPSLTAIEIQEAWAYGHNVNFLAAGANNPKVGSTGSGIYSGTRGALNSTINGVDKTILLTAEVPKIPAPNKEMKKVEKVTKTRDEIIEMDKLYLQTNDLRAYKNKNLDLSKSSQKIQLNFDNVTCDFDIVINNTTKVDDDSKFYRYEAVMFNGVRSFDFKNGAVLECLIVACTSDKFSSCSERFLDYSEIKPVVEFTKIDISTNVPLPQMNVTTNAIDSFYYPVSLTTSIEPLGVDEYGFEKVNTDDTQMIAMKLKKSQNELLAFGIYGRVFKNDHLPVTGAAFSSKNNIWNFSLFLGLFILLVSYFTRYE